MKVALIAVPILSLLGVGAASSTYRTHHNPRWLNRNMTLLSTSPLRKTFEYSLSGLGNIALKKSKKILKKVSRKTH